MSNKNYAPIIGAVAGTIASVIFCLGVYTGGHNKSHIDAVNTIKEAQTAIYDKTNHSSLSMEERKKFLKLGDHLGDAVELLQGKSLSDIIDKEAKRIQLEGK